MIHVRVTLWLIPKNTRNVTWKSNPLANPLTIPLDVVVTSYILYIYNPDPRDPLSRWAHILYIYSYIYLSIYTVHIGLNYRPQPAWTWTACEHLVQYTQSENYIAKNVLIQFKLLYLLLNCQWTFHIGFRYSHWNFNRVF